MLVAVQFNGGWSGTKSICDCYCWYQKVNGSLPTISWHKRVAMITRLFLIQVLSVDKLCPIHIANANQVKPQYAQRKSAKHKRLSISELSWASVAANVLATQRTRTKQLNG